jgi:transcriptional regulator with XRE-family HTH domain
MAEKLDGDGPDSISLGRYLAAIRADRKLSLRQVEEATEKEVSNAYLSQLENDRIKQPSPHILHALAELYAVEYTTLMFKAGYLKQQNSRNDTERHGRAVTFSDLNLSTDEELELLRFLRFMRAGKSSSSAAG